MKLFLLGPVVHGWDEYDSLVVKAPDAVRARKLALAFLKRKKAADDNRDASKKAACREITDADPDGIILGSFNAG